MKAPAKAPIPSGKSGIQLVEIRISNFRSLRNVSATLDRLTLLIGENNSGKTSFLEALNTSIGLGRRTNLADDLYLGPTESQAPKDRSAIIDILIRPTDENEKIIDSFPEGTPWLALWGGGIGQDKNDNDFCGMRTEIRWDSTRGEHVAKRNFITTWGSSIEEAKVSGLSINSSHIEPLALYMMDAKRDIKDEMQSRSSFWGRMLSDLGIAEEKVAELEETLTELNAAIVSGSPVLGHVQSHLNKLYRTIACEDGSVAITPLTRHLRDFNRGVDINFQTAGAQAFPLIRHGMGTRSLAAVLAFRAFTTWRQSQSKGNALHPMFALEEPEAHLHPHAQRALFDQLKEIPGQRIISTHSPYVASQATIQSIRHFKKIKSETEVTQIDTSGLTPEDLRKIARMVMNTRGDMLFARGIVLFEGDTEEQALPIFAEHYFGQHPNSIGLSLIAVGGPNYLPFLRLAQGFAIPWFILSDGEVGPIVHLKKALAEIKIQDYTKAKNVHVIPAGGNYESYLLSAGYEDAAREMLETLEGKEFLDRYLRTQDGQPGKKGVRDYKSAGGMQRALFDVLSEKKTACAALLAKQIVDLPKKDRQMPPLFRSLFDTVAETLHLEKA
jgi:putative ATP-dependent endonuclease of OLD family